MLAHALFHYVSTFFLIGCFNVGRCIKCFEIKECSYFFFVSWLLEVCSKLSSVNHLERLDKWIDVLRLYCCITIHTSLLWQLTTWHMSLCVISTDVIDWGVMMTNKFVYLCRQETAFWNSLREEGKGGLQRWMLVRLSFSLNSSMTLWREWPSVVAGKYAWQAVCIRGYGDKGNAGNVACDSMEVQ